MQIEDKFRIFSPGIGTVTVTVIHISRTINNTLAQDKNKFLYDYVGAEIWRRGKMLYYTLDKDGTIINKDFREKYQDMVEGKNQITLKSSPI